MSRYIDADELKKTLFVIDIKPTMANPFGDYQLVVSKHDIDTTPTADVTPIRHGKWIIREDYYHEPLVCSKCGKEAYHESKFEEIFDYDWDENLTSMGYEEHREYIRSNYCPHCGAKMDEILSSEEVD